MTRKVSAPKCPRCGSDSLVLHEVWSQPTINFWVSDGRIDPVGNINQPDAAEKVIGECSKCQHTWTLKGVRSVQQLPNWPPD